MSIVPKVMVMIKKSEIHRKKKRQIEKKFNSSIETIRQYNIYNHIMIINRTNFLRE